MDTIPLVQKQNTTPFVLRFVEWFRDAGAVLAFPLPADELKLVLHIVLILLPFH